MEAVKIMPCLDMKDGRVVKGVHFVNLRDAGDPVKNAEFYQSEGADELAMLDIAATLENRKTRLEWVKQVSSVIEIPLTVGGGINSVEDIELVLKAGADKVSMNSVIVRDPQFLGQNTTVTVSLSLQLRSKRTAHRGPKAPGSRNLGFSRCCGSQLGPTHP